MTELLKAALHGWGQFISDGKVAILLVAALLFLRAYYDKLKSKELWIYSTFAAVCCMIPVTAAVLMLYQTKVYSYYWVWSVVPMTAVVGYAVTVLLTEYLPEQGPKGKSRIVPVTLMLLAIFLLSGSLDTAELANKEYRNRKPGVMTEQEETAAEDTARVLAEVKKRFADDRIVLWAPREIMEYAREYDSGVMLLYGRNIWDASLDILVDDVYPPEIYELQNWMDRAESGDDPKTCMTGPEVVRGYLTVAAANGVNCILLGEDTEADTVKLLENMWDTKAERLEGLYLFVKRGNDNE